MQSLGRPTVSLQESILCGCFTSVQLSGVARSLILAGHLLYTSPLASRSRAQSAREQDKHGGPVFATLLVQLLITVMTPSVNVATHPKTICRSLTVIPQILAFQKNLSLVPSSLGKDFLSLGTLSVLDGSVTFLSRQNHFVHILYTCIGHNVQCTPSFAMTAISLQKSPSKLNRSTSWGDTETSDSRELKVLFKCTNASIYYHTHARSMVSVAYYLCLVNW